MTALTVRRQNQDVMAANSDREFWWAILRLLLGLLQIAGATAALILLLNSAPVWLTSVAVGATLLLTGISRILFSRRGVKAGR